MEEEKAARKGDDLALMMVAMRALEMEKVKVLKTEQDLASWKVLKMV